MQLLDYLVQNGITQAQFAERLGTTAATICRIADGAVVPRRELMLKIYDQTGGQVTPNDLVGVASTHVSEPNR